MTMWKPKTIRLFLSPPDITIHKCNIGSRPNGWPEWANASPTSIDSCFILRGKAVRAVLPDALKRSRNWWKTIRFYWIWKGTQHSRKRFFPSWRTKADFEISALSKLHLQLARQ